MIQSDKEMLYSKLEKMIELEKGAMAIGSVEEAHAAAAAIQRMLLKYNLHLVELTSKPEFEFVFGTYFPQKDSNGSRWRISLMTCLARHNRCKCMTRNDGTMTTLGTEENVIAVCNLFSYLTAAFSRFARKERHKRSFLYGCVVGLNVRLAREDRDCCNHEKDSKSNHCTEKALTVLELNERYNKALDDYIGKHAFKTRSLPKTRNIDSAAYHRGMDKGMSVSLIKQIEGKTILNE